MEFGRERRIRLGGGEIDAFDGEAVDGVFGDSRPENEVEDAGGDCGGEEEGEDEAKDPGEAATAATPAGFLPLFVAAGVFRRRNAVDLVLGDLDDVSSRRRRGFWRLGRVVLRLRIGGSGGGRGVSGRVDAVCHCRDLTSPIECRPRGRFGLFSLYKLLEYTKRQRSDLDRSYEITEGQNEKIKKIKKTKSKRISDGSRETVSAKPRTKLQSEETKKTNLFFFRNQRPRSSPN